MSETVPNERPGRCIPGEMREPHPYYCLVILSIALSMASLTEVARAQTPAAAQEPAAQAAEPSATATAPTEKEAQGQVGGDYYPREQPAVKTLNTVCEGRTVRNIRIEGQGRVSADDIKATIRLRSGLPCTDSEVARDVRALWDMGYFDDIAVEAKPEGNQLVLVYRVRERPAISTVIFSGNDEISEEDLKKAISLEEGAILSVPEVKRQLEKITAKYAEEGYFLAKVAYELRKQPNNQVEIRFVITEGEQVTIRHIRFLGNEHLSDSELKGVIQTGETGLMSFLSSNNKFKKANYDEDLNRVRAYYYDFGYLAVQLPDPRVELTADRRHIDITISIKEGPRFRVRKVEAGEIDAKGKQIEPLAGRKNLREQVHLNKGDWFSRSVIAKDLQDITRYYRDRGYAKVEVNPQTELDEKNRLVDVNVSIQRGPLVYVQRINVKGNTKTRDAVIRRETRISEDELYNQTKVERSKERINALGYFEKVEVSEEPGAAADRMVINFEVVEKSTGTFQLGMGFSSLESFMFTGQIEQQNLIGRGQSLAFSLQLSGIRQLMQLRFTEPYLYGTPWSLSVELFKILTQFRNFEQDSTGGAISLGHPIFHEDLALFLKYRLEDTEISPSTGGFLGGGAGEMYYMNPTIPLRNLFLDGLVSSLRLTLQWDSRDNRLFPTKGVLASISTEVSDKYLGSSTDFWRHEGNLRLYHPLIWGAVAKFNTQLGVVTSRDDQGVPVYERYFLGGIFDIRGFPFRSVGPHIGLPYYLSPQSDARKRGEAIGGNAELYYNFEIEFPILEVVGIKGVLFTDGGNAWNLEKPLCGQAPSAEYSDPAATSCGVHPFNLRTSIGWGIRWFSPLGPLRFEWGYPFSPRRPYEGTSEFQFMVGNSF
jgi:outer membrane protein insertion porin family